MTPRVIDQPVLILNRSWQPVGILSVGVAITTVMREMGWVVDPVSFEVLEFETWCERQPAGARLVKTPSGGVPAPEIVLLREYAAQPRRKVTFSRRNLLRRDEACQYCGHVAGRDEFTIDHVLPRSRGGPTTWENCVLACEPCNRRKADRTPREAGMPLRTEPARPKWKPRFVVSRRHYRSSWGTFLAKANMEVELTGG